MDRHREWQQQGRDTEDSFQLRNTRFGFGSADPKPRDYVMQERNKTNNAVGGKALGLSGSWIAIATPLAGARADDLPGGGVPGEAS
jgi:hypothetical protein